MTDETNPPAEQKIWDRDSIWEILDQSDYAVTSALKRIYARQTPEERTAKSNQANNSRGFTGFDAEFLTDIAQKYERYGTITPGQLKAVRAAIKKYWKQLLEETELKGGKVDYNAHTRRERARKREEAKAAGTPPEDE